jgi:ADP-heptose:LPS heptosyltransferase
MNISKMRAIDSWAGIPICLFLHVVCSISGILKRPFSIFPYRKKREIRKILVMKYLGMGSIILSLPMLRALRAKFPQASITFVTFEKNREICELLNIGDMIFTIRTASFWLFLNDLFLTLWKIRREKFDISIDMEFFSKFSLIVSYLSGAHVRVGYFIREIWRMGNLLTVKVYYNPYRHMTEVFLALARAIGADTDDMGLIEIKIPQERKKELDLILKSKGFTNRFPLIVMNVNAGELSLERRWPSENFLILSNRLLREYPIEIVFIGEEVDRNYIRGVIAQIEKRERVIDLSGSLSIGHLLALFERSILFITNDSGPMHLSSLSSIPTIALFGPESPLLYSPLGKDKTIFYKGLYCSPCLSVYNSKQTDCKDNICMRSISAEEVYEVARKRIEEAILNDRKNP